MADDKKILQFPTGEIPQCPVDVEHDNNWSCKHGRIRLVEADRTVVCADCGKVFDPFGYLLLEANTLIAAWRDHKMVVGRNEYLRDENQRLEKERKRLAAAVRRGKEREKHQQDNGIMEMRPK
jgi:hypothetical protein